MKVIFLDMDGVMNDISWIHHIKRVTLDRNNTSWRRKVLHMEPNRVGRLNRIIEATGAGIVMISTWRISMSEDDLPILYRETGIKGVSLGKTGTQQTRAEEILEWLGEHPEVTSYLILDDEPDARIWGDDYFPELARCWVKTNWGTKTLEGGLLDEHVEPAIRILSTNSVCDISVQR